MLEDSIEKLTNDIGYLTNSNAYVKFNDDEVWPIEYVRLDDMVYSNKEKMAERLISYGNNVREAMMMVRDYMCVEDLGEHIDPFIVKYHPAWIFLRESYGFTGPEEGEVLCKKEPSPSTFMEHYQNNFLALGFNVPYNEKINKDALMSYDVFESLFSEELMREAAMSGKHHPDFIALQNVIDLKLKIDYYNRKIGEGTSPKELHINFKSVGYQLGSDGFPLLTVGSNKNKKSFDFRKMSDYRGFLIKLAQKNPQSQLGMEYKKVLRKRKN